MNINTVQRIIEETQAYPEGRISFENLRSSLHCASFIGNILSLKLWLKELQKRYSDNLKVKDFNIKKPETPWYDLIFDKIKTAKWFKKYNRIRK